MGGQLQTNNEIIETPQEEIRQTIKGVEIIIESEYLNTSGDKDGGVRSFVETEDKRIASGGYDGNISISSYDVNEKKWNRDIYKKKAHKDSVSSLCTSNNNRLLSSSWDHLIKIWSLSKRSLTLITKIKEHTDYVHNIIPLSEGRFASCSRDRTIRIWKDDKKFQCLSKLDEQYVSSILQLKSKEVLVSLSTWSITFWDIKNYTKLHTLKGNDITGANRMVELSNGNIAISYSVKPNPIIIIDSSSYQIITVIQLKKYITFDSCLCALNQSLIYAYRGTFLQISCEDYSVLFYSNNVSFKPLGGRFIGDYGIIPLKGGKYFAVDSDKRIYIIQPCYA